LAFEFDPVAEREIGHYFDQVFAHPLDALMACRALISDFESELESLGVVIDPMTGEVRMTAG
jgi:hypothetical protein